MTLLLAENILVTTLSLFSTRQGHIICNVGQNLTANTVIRHCSVFACYSFERFPYGYMSVNMPSAGLAQWQLMLEWHVDPIFCCITHVTIHLYGRLRPVRAYIAFSQTVLIQPATLSSSQFASFSTSSTIAYIC